MLIEFRRAVDAVSFALSVREKLTHRESDVADGQRPRFLTVINVGDVIIQDDDIFGDGANIAARLEGIAEPVSVMISRSVREHIDGKIDAKSEFAGDRELKNISRKVPAWSLARGAGQDPVRSGPAPSVPDKPSIAILLFTDMSGDEESAFFADGITEDIITEL